MPMKTGIRELKAHLSKYIGRVRKGETIAITDRGVEVARLVPVAKASEADWAWEMVREGKATWGGGKPTGLKHRIPTRGKPTSDIVLRDRDERF